MKKILGILISVLLLAGASVYVLVWVAPNSIDPYLYNSSVANSGMIIKVTDEITHVDTPDSVKAIYMTGWVAGSLSLREKLVKLIDTTELNSVVIDVKDYSGRLSFIPSDPSLQKIGSGESRVKDMKAFVKELHDKNIYVIARISSFQDAYLVGARPDLAVKRKSDGKVWKDNKGISWLDPGSEEVWHYLTEIGKEAYSVGFDELNFDYIRFPSDGDMNNISYTFSTSTKKALVIKNFFSYLRDNLGDIAEKGKPTVKLSADLFGMTTTNSDDLGIGQVMENALPYMDYICQMVYPSHYPATFMGFATPAEKPYEVVKYSMDKAVARVRVASSSIAKLRPWLQDFSIGHTTYTADMVRAQMTATYDSGLNSWLLWNASNKYTESALIHTTSSESKYPHPPPHY
ncbi:MAG: GTP-binding protein [Candidatus Taylorbacteria bacterium]|nr:GTP-binding protein [Candidatus Taylorbacteria bacterium]